MLSLVAELREELARKRPKINPPTTETVDALRSLAGPLGNRPDPLVEGYARSRMPWSQQEEQGVRREYNRQGVEGLAASVPALRTMRRAFSTTTKLQGATDVHVAQYGYDPQNPATWEPAVEQAKAEARRRAALGVAENPQLIFPGQEQTIGQGLAEFGGQVASLNKQIPGLKPVQRAAGEAVRFLGEHQLVSPVGLGGAGVMTDEQRKQTGDFYAALAEAAVPTTIGGVALELVPGIGAIPGSASAIRELMPALRIAARRYGMSLEEYVASRQGKEGLARLLERRGIKPVAGGADDIPGEPPVGPEGKPAGAPAAGERANLPVPPEATPIGQLLSETGTLTPIEAPKALGRTRFNRPGLLTDTGAGGQPVVQGIASDIVQPPPGVGGADIVGTQLARDRAAVQTTRAASPPVQGVSERGAPKPPGVGGEDVVGAQLQRDAALYERAFGTSEPPPMPEALSPVTVEKYLPERQGYIDQVARAQEAVDAAKQRVKDVRAAYQSQAQRRTAVRAAKAKGMSEVPEGMLSKNEIKAAEKDVRDAVKTKREAKRTLDQADVLMNVNDILDEATKGGGDKATIDAVRQAATDAAEFAQAGMKSDAGQPGWTARIRGAVANVKGETPSAAVNAVSRAHLVLENAMRHVTDDWLGTWASKIDDVIAKNRDTLKYIGPANRAALAEENFAHAVVIHPEWFSGKSPELLAILRETQSFQRSKYAIIQALDPKAAAALEDIGYLRTVWDIPENKLTTSLPKPGGRVGVTKARGWPDPFDALASPTWPYKLKDMTAGELIESSAHLSDRQIGMRMERKLILERYGRKAAQPKASGYVRASNPNYAGWWLPKEVNNFIDQLHQPGSAMIRTASGPLNEFKNLVYGAADIAVFGGHMLELTTTRGTAAATGVINRSLEAMHLPHFDVYMRGDMSRATQRSLAGLPQGIAGANVTLKGGTLFSWGGKYNPLGRALDKKVVTPIIDAATRAQYQGVLTPARNMVYEGNLIMASVLHKLTRLERFNPESAVVKRAAGENASAFSGASLNALKEGRRAGEQATLGSAQITRAMASQIGQLAKIARPDTFEGLLATSTLATFAFTVYGMGSALNMAFGSGEPVAFDPRKSDWARVRLFGHWATVDGEQKYVGGQNIAMLPQASLIRTLAKSVAAVQAGDGNKFIKAWEQLAYTRSTPALQIPQNLAGFGFDPARGFRTGDLSFNQRLLQSAPLPPTISSGLLEGAGKGETALNFFGLQSYPGDTADEIHKANQKAARANLPDKFDAIWKNDGWEPFVAKQLAESWDYPGAGSQKIKAIAEGLSGHQTPLEARTAFVTAAVPIYADMYGVMPEVARDELTVEWDALQQVKQYKKAVEYDRLAYWKEHPDELAKAYEMGVEDLNKEERKIYDAYKAGQPVGASP